MNNSKSISWIVLIILFLPIIGCKDVHLGSGYVNAAISQGDECFFAVNYTDDEVYGYRGDHLFFTPSIQAGGHANNGDLGANIFALTTAGLTVGEYDINSGGGLPGTAYLFYLPDRDDNQVQYISVDGTAKLLVTKLELKDNGNGLLEVAEIEYEFMEPVLLSDYESGDTICINGMTCGYSR